MKTFISVIILLWCTATSFSQKTETKNTFTKLWETGSGLNIPESVLFDAASGKIYVSNIQGKPSDKDKTGYISLLSADGSITNTEWVSGIDAPKGMGIYKNHLFVTNIDEVVEIDIPGAKIIRRYPIEGSKFLNDIAIDPSNGTVYITDSGSGQVYSLTKGKVKLWLTGLQYKGANGLCWKHNKLYIGAGNNIWSANPKSDKTEVWVENTGSVDGLYVTADNTFIFSDWKGSVYMAKKGSKPELLN